MKKIEMIWRELLWQRLEKGVSRFTQKEIAQKFAFSTSTVSLSLKDLRQMGIVRVTGRFFTLEDPIKLMYHWGSVRNLAKDIIKKVRVDLSVAEIEGLAPPGVIFGGYSAAKKYLEELPADYSQVFLYVDDVEKAGERYEYKAGPANLILLKKDQWLVKYGQVTTLAQTFVDLWNTPEWYAREFVEALVKEANERLLS